jgi:hypothetical protein
MYKIKIKVRVFMNLPLLHVNGILKHISSNQYNIETENFFYDVHDKDMAF